MKDWEKKVKELLAKSLKTIPNELNELDWKSDLSTKTERLAQHLSAFANQFGGGFMVYGVDNNGIPFNLDKERVDLITSTLGNIARHNLEPSVILDHLIFEYEGENLLAIYIGESGIKPVHLKNKDIYHSYIRIAGQTRKMSKSEIKRFIASSSNIHFEEQNAVSEVNIDEIISNLDHDSYFQLMDVKYPETKMGILSRFLEEGFISKLTGDQFSILNLGAILFAKDISKFKNLQRKAIRVIIYDGNNRLKTMKEQVGQKVYASGFEGIVRYV